MGAIMNETLRIKPWHEYYEAHAGRPPFRLLPDAIAAAPDREAALDVGAGPLNESRALLDAGFKRVVALDREREVALRAEQIGDPRLSAEIVSFQRYAFPPENFSLVVASKALPFAGKDLGRVLEGIKRSLKPGGIFVGNLFGARHAFNNNVSLRFFSEEEARHLFDDMELLSFEPYEQDEQSKTGPLHWHSFDFLARKTR
jgi:SAM-dependent methyltransferase